jgi:hypothetical protein
MEMYGVEGLGKRVGIDIGMRLDTLYSIEEVYF